ncbi:Involved in expression of fibrinogen binding protein%2C phage associated [Staphylococcus aureus]|nr:Complement inhibitor SCIN [Staphylococcus aureus subsp. aureus CN1]ASI55988.1 hypothetical protein FORC40_1784 [Staphylococcus aureus]EOR32199.1 hypothetical protein S103564_2655 [Staphylococcus aureus subsp. aureus 103564]EUJ94945.1 complement inhibitor [Staphylococcus aureus DAR5891]EUX10227.1 complement inhibitor [Staphylococcus aureus M0318]EVF84224.1 complement inhibitor [Staphylococcus aureus COAS6020]GJF52322.1 hypothetical protein SA19086_16290 [Staphylococcus argenteus]
MKIRKSILAGTLAIVLASPLVTNLDKNEAQACQHRMNIKTKS